jgi:hypothetical protein
MNYALKIGVSAMRYIPNFIKIGSVRYSKADVGEDKQIHSKLIS